MPISRKYPNIKKNVFPLPRTPKERPHGRSDSDSTEDINNMNHFMAVACLASLRSKDPSRQVIIIIYNAIQLINDLIGWGMPC